MSSPLTKYLSASDVEVCIVGPVYPSLEPADSDLVSTSGIPTTPKTTRGTTFWLVILAVCVSTFLSALDLTVGGTALPTMLTDIQGTSFAWIGSAYTLSAAAWLPLSGALANAFGRQPIILVSLIFFAIGSAICGEASNMTMIIASRAVQGLGCGGIISLTEIIVADLVPLQERGFFVVLIGLVWALASTLGPPTGGVFAQDASWRWIFRLNLPLTFIAFVLVSCFLRLKKPAGKIINKLKRIDWWGILLLIASTAGVTVAPTRGGIDTPWTSVQTLVPLILGLVGIAVFFVVEGLWIEEPSVPFSSLSNRTSLSGYIGTFLHSLVTTALIYYLPVYFQACLGASPVRSGIDLFGAAFTIAPAGIVGGISVVILKRYLWQNYFGWVLITIGCGILSLLRPSSSAAMWVGLEVVTGVGLGFIYMVTKFPILAPVPVTRNASAMALFAFSRVFAQTFGITIGSPVLQNELLRRLPADFIALLPTCVNVAFAAIPAIPGLPEAVGAEAKEAFAFSLSVLWLSLLGFCGAGLLSVVFMKDVPLASKTDSQWDKSSEPVDKVAKPYNCSVSQRSNTNTMDI